MTHILKAYIDTLLVMVVTLSIVIATMHMEQKKENEESRKQIAMIEATIVWPQGDIDVDLWLNGPGQDRATGYSNKSGITWDLLRDDLGDIGDELPMNYENGFVRNFKPGEYTINVHYYRDRAAHGPVTVNIELVIELGKRRKVINKTIVLSELDEEQTAINLKIDKDGNVTDINSVYVPLRTAAVAEDAPQFGERE